MKPKSSFKNWGLIMLLFHSKLCIVFQLAQTKTQSHYHGSGDLTCPPLDTSLIIFSTGFFFPCSTPPVLPLCCSSNPPSFYLRNFARNLAGVSQLYTWITSFPPPGPWASTVLPVRLCLTALTKSTPVLTSISHTHPELIYHIILLMFL